MKYLAGAAMLTALLGFSSHPTLAQTQLDHDVQKMWDDTFHPEQRGDPRSGRFLEVYQTGRRVDDENA